MPQIHLSDGILAEIVRIGLEARPSEACGVLLPTPLIRAYGEAGQVVRMPNRAMEHTTSYTIHGDDVRLALEEWSKSASIELQNMIALWHTHPGGNIGPSPRDMRTRVSGVPYLVVALIDDVGVPTWF